MLHEHLHDGLVDGVILHVSIDEHFQDVPVWISRWVGVSQVALRVTLRFQFLKLFVEILSQPLDNTVLRPVDLVEAVQRYHLQHRRDERVGDLAKSTDLLLQHRTDSLVGGDVLQHQERRVVVDVLAKTTWSLDLVAVVDSRLDRVINDRKHNFTVPQQRHLFEKFKLRHRPAIGRMRNLAAQVSLELVYRFRSRFGGGPQGVEDLGSFHDDPQHHRVLTELIHRHASRLQRFHDLALRPHHQGMDRGIDSEHLVQQRLEVTGLLD